MPRKRLKKLEGRRLTVSATVERKGKARGYFGDNMDTVLLTNICTSNRCKETLSDHVWIRPTDMAQDEPFIKSPKGTQIKFKCSVATYCRPSDKHTDATLTGICDVEIINR